MMILTGPIDLRIATTKAVRDRILEAAEYIAVEQLGATNDRGFSAFRDDTCESRDITFENIRARVQDAALAAQTIEGW